MKTSKLLARAALPAGAALLSLSAWAVASSAMPVVPDPSSPSMQQAEPAAAVAPAVAVDEPVLAPQVGNMKYSCRADPVVAAAATEAGRAQ